MVYDPIPTWRSICFGVSVGALLFVLGLAIFAYDQALLFDLTGTPVVYVSLATVGANIMRAFEASKRMRSP